MQFKKQHIGIAITILGIIASRLNSQDMNRHMRIPENSAPYIIRHQLQGTSDHGTTLKLRYETSPVSPLFRMIRKNFPELFVTATEAEELIDTGKSTILLEQLQIELENYQLIATDTKDAKSASPTRSLF
jgi:hypothetical protein